MHEVGLIAGVLEQAVAAAREAGAKRIHGLTFVVASGGRIAPSSVEALFSALSRGTIAEGATLKIELQPRRHLCLACGKTCVSASDDVCPSCGNALLPERRAPELVLSSVEVD